MLSGGFTRRSPPGANGTARVMTRERQRARGPSASIVAAGAIPAALLLACAAQAQEAGSVSGYRLPPPTTRSPAPVEGPVDSDHPVAVPASPAPEAPPEAAPTPPQISVPEVPALPGSSDATRQRPLPRAAASPPAASPYPAPLASESPEPSSPAPQATMAASPAPQGAAASPEPEAAWLVPLLGLLALLAAAGAFLWWRKRPADDTAEPEPAGEAEPAIPPSAPAVLAPIGRIPRPRPQPQPLQPAAGPLAFGFEAQSLRLSFVYATLAYRLELSNGGESAFSDLRISADLTSGHATLPVARQLDPGEAELLEKHCLAALVPGETLALSGELSCPIAEILPLRAGAALLFAPLARFRIDTQCSQGNRLSETFIFTLGLPSPRHGETMQPFRVDLGPQLFRPIEQRPVDAARWLELDGQRRAG